MDDAVTPLELPPALRRTVRLVRALCLFGAAVLLAVPVWFWTSPEAVRELAPQLAGVRETTVDTQVQLLGALLSVAPVALGLYALWQLWRLFGEYARGRVFGRPALARLRRFAWALLGSALLAPLVRAAASVLLTMGNPPGRRMLALSLSWNDYMAVLLAAVLIAIATVMAEAVRVAEDHQGFV
ncbi:MAG: DUF2975 domain-containing protein [Piscinibacter sp.]|nr:DUF2975 domain-containing protein [Piscinibacter sp.]